MTEPLSTDSTEEAESAKPGPILVIVESPTKAKTLGKLLGSGYRVEATKGHVRELYAVATTLGNYTPRYRALTKKTALLRDLAVLAATSSKVILATDDDREGEAIADDLRTLLRLPDKVERVVFHEITPSAIAGAFAAPRAIDPLLVEAQRARQILDWLLGVHLSQAVARQVAGYRWNRNYASGRVQAPTLVLLVDKEMSRRQFIPASYCTLEVTTSTGETLQLREVNGQRLADNGSDFDGNGKVAANRTLLAQADSKAWEAALRGAALTARSIKTTQRSESPKAAFTTATLQQAASTYLGFPPHETMSHAQKLYELGLISYMRTDSATLSAAAIAACTQEITTLGQALVQRSGKTTSHAQNAHEAIRPAIDSTGRFLTPAAASAAVSAARPLALFDLIWRRTVASQMADCLRSHTTTTFEVSIDGDLLTFVLNGSQVVSDGFRTVWSHAGEPSKLAGSYVTGQLIQVVSAASATQVTAPPRRFSEAGLIKEMVNLGIGRPSTYAPTIRKLIEHNFARLADGRTLVPTPRGVLVAAMLKSFTSGSGGGSISNAGLTAAMEQGLDMVANGTQTRQAFLSGVLGAGLLANLEVLAQSQPTFKTLVLGSYPCGGSRPCATACASGNLSLRAGTGKRLDYAECAACAARCSLPDMCTYGDSTDTELSQWVHSRQDRLLGTHNGSALWVRYGDTGNYLEAIGNQTKPVSWPLGEDNDPATMTFEEAVNITERPRVPRILGHSPAAGFPVWIRRNSKDELLIEAGPDASTPPRRGKRATARRTVQLPLPEGLDADVQLPDVAELVDAALEKNFPGEEQAANQRPSSAAAQGTPVLPEEIVEHLRWSPDSTAREIAKGLRGHTSKEVRKQINSILYKNPERFSSDGGATPRWKLR